MSTLWPDATHPASSEAWDTPTPLPTYATQDEFLGALSDPAGLQLHVSTRNAAGVITRAERALRSTNVDQLAGHLVRVQEATEDVEQRIEDAVRQNEFDYDLALAGLITPDEYRSEQTKLSRQARTLHKLRSKLAALSVVLRRRLTDIVRESATVDTATLRPRWNGIRSLERVYAFLSALAASASQFAPHAVVVYSLIKRTVRQTQHGAPTRYSPAHAPPASRKSAERVRTLTAPNSPPCALAA